MQAKSKHHTLFMKNQKSKKVFTLRQNMLGQGCKLEFIHTLYNVFYIDGLMHTTKYTRINLNNHAAYFNSDVRWSCAKQLKSIITFKKHYGPITYKHIIL